MPSSSGTESRNDQRPQAPASRPAPADARADADAAARAAQLAVDLEQLRNSYLRARADLENYRKRSAAEVERRVGEQREKLLRDWLDIVDSVDRALGIDHGSGVQEGLRAVLDQMQAVLTRHGAERLEPQGERFDPEVHEAVATRVDDGVPERTVIGVPRAGYKLGDRVLRPAQVVVSRRSPGGED